MLVDTLQSPWAQNTQENQIIESAEWQIVGIGRCAGYMSDGEQSVQVDATKVDISSKRETPALHLVSLMQSRVVLI